MSTPLPMHLTPEPGLLAPALSEMNNFTSLLSQDQDRSTAPAAAAADRLPYIYSTVGTTDTYHPIHTGRLLHLVGCPPCHPAILEISVHPAVPSTIATSTNLTILSWVGQWHTLPLKENTVLYSPSLKIPCSVTLCRSQWNNSVQCVAIQRQKCSNCTSILSLYLYQHRTIIRRNCLTRYVLSRRRSANGFASIFR